MAAVTFLMSLFSAGLSNADYSDNNADDCHYNTDNSKDYFEHHILYLSHIFHYVPPPDTGSSQNVLILAKGEPLTV